MAPVTLTRELLPFPLLGSLWFWNVQTHSEILWNLHKSEIYAERRSFDSPDVPTKVFNEELKRSELRSELDLSQSSNSPTCIPPKWKATIFWMFSLLALPAISRSSGNSGACFCLAGVKEKEGRPTTCQILPDLGTARAAPEGENRYSAGSMWAGQEARG